MQVLQQPQLIEEAEIFSYPLKAGQVEIIGAVLDPEIKRLIVSATTQYGKTRAVAIGILTDLLDNADPKNPNRKKKKVLFIAPTIDQTNIIRNYVAEHISATPQLAALVDHTAHTGPENLKSEMSKKRLTFKHGWEILTLTAHGEENSKEPGKQLMGFGGDIVVLDEACLILDVVYRQRIKRMLGSNSKAKIIILVNPWNRLNFAYRAWLNPKFRKIHIGYQQAIDEGRVTEEFIQEQKEELSEYEFAVLYESIFAVESEDTLIRYDWIERAAKKQIQFTGQPQTVWGLDVAEQGADLTILTRAETDGIQYAVKEQQWIREHETMPTANHVSLIVPKAESLNVDSIGVGAGVYSRLIELGHKTVSVRVSMAPASEANRYINQKSQRWWRLRTIFEQDLISIPNNPKLISQLSQMRYQFTSAGKIQIIDPEGKSPDYADSLMLTILAPGSVQALTGKSLYG
jgi:hypothetical protein